MNYKEKRKLKKSGFELPILGHGSAPFLLSNDFFNNTIAEKVIQKNLKNESSQQKLVSDLIDKIKFEKN